MVADHRPSDSLPTDVVAAIQQGNKIDAIKRLCIARNLGLKDAKDVVDNYVHNDPALTRKYQQQTANTHRVLWFIVFGTIATALLYWLS